MGTVKTPAFESDEQEERLSSCSDDDLEHLLVKDSTGDNFRAKTANSFWSKPRSSSGMLYEELVIAEDWQLLITPTSDRLKKFTRLSVPLLLSFVSMNLDEMSINFV
mgnify:CR=1 FL=1